MKFNRFEDLPIWQESRLLSQKIFDATTNQTFKDFFLRDQMRRAAISVVSNIAEGFERGSNKEFIQFLYVAKGSTGELRSQCYVCYDSEYVTQDEFNKLIASCEGLSKKISNFISYLRASHLTNYRHKSK